MVFRSVPISVSVGEQIIFRFETPLSLMEFVVAGRDEDIVWEFMASEFQPTPIESGSFRSWPINEAPPEMVAMLSQIQEREDHRLQTEGPRKPPLSEVVYGNIPAGYREETPAKALRPGEYNVLVFAEQGQGSARFTITS